ncbi:MAG: hypothetical protein SFV18_00870 [Bryobacteraceae bacterium]|nr:hypothetical protein [Bryobacteraceae bacterium]
MASQYVMAGFEIAEKIDGLTAYQQLPERRLHILSDGQLDGNIICGPDGRQHELDNHNSFEKRMQNYVIGTNLLALVTDEEIARGREQTLEALRDILHKKGDSPVQVVGRWGSKLDEKQILDLRSWLQGLKGNHN